MKTIRSLPSLLLLGLISSLMCGSPRAHAGQFKRITIDGSFADWAGVPPAFEDAEDATDSFDFKEIYLANDENYLYVRVRLYQARDYASFHHQVVIDADADLATGHAWVGVGSELLIEDGQPYQQKNGAFNEGAGSNLDWAVAPTGRINEFEARISRNVRDAEGLAVFNKDAFALALNVLNPNWESKDSVPGGEGIQYEFAPTPTKATGTRSLVSLGGNAWRYNDTGSDLGINWLAMDYDDTQAGWGSGPGLFGFGSPTGTYPGPIRTTLAAGRTTYYLRAPFTWNFDPNGIALVVSNYLSDGAVFYLNGVEVKRLRLPEGQLGYGSLASSGPVQPGQAEVFGLPSTALVVGDNLLEVEVHASVVAPQMLAFGLELAASDKLPPSIEDPTQPTDRSVVEGEPTTFTAGRVLGTEPLSYQWFKDGSRIPDATNASYAISVVLVSDAGSYSVEISNATATKAASRSAILTTTGNPVAIVDATQPGDRTITEGESTTFTLEVSGSPTFYFQWLKDGTPIDGATAAQYVINNARLTDAGSYSVTVSNRLNQVTSRTARLGVRSDTSPPQIAQATGSGGKIVVTFSEALDEASAKSAANYSLTGGATVQTAELDLPDARTVTLGTTPLTFGTAYTLGVAGAKDRFNNVAATSFPFRASIVIDGNFDDWAGIAPAHSEPQDTPEGVEFKDISVANDDEYLFIRFSFHTEVGQLPVDYYFHVFSDTDNDSATGMGVAGTGSEMMIENGGGYQQKNGGFNEGVVRDLGFALGPEARASEFECRISRRAVYDSDSLPVYRGAAVALAFQLINTSWTPVDTVPQGASLVYTFVELPSMNPGPLKVSITSGNVQISWTGPGTLEARESLSSGAWAPVSNPANPYQVSPTGQQRYYRLRL